MLAEQFKGTDRYNKIMDSVDDLTMEDAMAAHAKKQKSDDHTADSDPF